MSFRNNFFPYPNGEKDRLLMMKCKKRTLFIKPRRAKYVLLFLISFPRGEQLLRERCPGPDLLHHPHPVPRPVLLLGEQHRQVPQLPPLHPRLRTEDEGAVQRAHRLRRRLKRLRQRAGALGPAQDLQVCARAKIQLSFTGFFGAYLQREERCDM